jgi:hypothetical protein
MGGGAGGLLAFGSVVLGLIGLSIMWFVQTLLASPNNEIQQSGLKECVLMKKIMVLSCVTMAANGLTALFVNALPALSINLNDLSLRKP